MGYYDENDNSPYSLVVCITCGVEVPMFFYNQRSAKNTGGHVTGRLTVKNDKIIRANLPRGLVQITACWHPSVSDEEAYDPAFSLEFLAKNLKKGRCHWWTTCRRYTKTKIYVSLL